MFRDLIPLLADRYHLIAPDYPGFGYIARPVVSEFDYTFDHLADVMEGFVDTLELARYAIYMQDFGGPVGFRLTRRAYRPAFETWCFASGRSERLFAQVSAAHSHRLGKG
jgi:pimeloyl-ACP methyl ester carboxylesterase